MSCSFIFESTNYVSFISTLQLHKIIQNEVTWPFKVSILDAVHTQSIGMQYLVIQLQETAKRDQENQKQIINLQEGDNQYFIYDANITKGHNLGKLALTIIKSSNELMRILDSINGLEKPKKEIKGKGISFEHSDFIVKIGEFKKQNKNMILMLVCYKPFAVLPLEIIQEIYKEYYSAYLKRLFSLFNNYQDFISFQEQVQQQKEFLNFHIKEWESQQRERQKDPLSKELEEKEKLASHNVIYFGELMMVHNMIGLFSQQN